jgi:hypothetical protein
MEEEKKLIEYALLNLYENIDNKALEELSELLKMDSDEVETFIEDVLEDYTL